MLEKSDSASAGDGYRARSLVTTHWGVVLAAQDDLSPRAAQALEKLCRAYWHPAYASIRRQGGSPSDAGDLTQAFFAWLLESKDLSVGNQEHRKFRAFLWKRLKHFLSDEQQNAHVQKRGQGQTTISVDARLAEERLRSEPSTDLTPERHFDRRWALTVMERSVTRLRAEYVAADQRDLFDELRHYKPGQGDARSYTEVAARLKLSQSAVRSEVWRLRQRHGDLLRDEIAQTVATPAEVEDEMRYLISMLGV